MHKTLSAASLPFAYVLAVACNAGCFWWGDPPGFEQIAATALYLLVWGRLLLRPEAGEKFLRRSSILGAAGILGAALALLTRAGADLLLIPALLLSGALFSPLYGVKWIAGDTDLFYLAAGLLSLLLLLLCRWRSRRYRTAQSHIAE